MDKIPAILKENLKYYRKRAGLSQQKLAEACDLSVAYVGGIEIGIKYPSLRTLEKMATVLGIDLFRLLLPPNHREELLRKYNKEILREIGKTMQEMEKRF